MDKELLIRKVTAKMRQYGYYNEDAQEALIAWCEASNANLEQFNTVNNTTTMSGIVKTAIMWKGGHGGFRNTTAADVFANRRSSRHDVDRKRRMHDMMRGKIRFS